MRGIPLRRLGQPSDAIDNPEAETTDSDSFGADLVFSDPNTSPEDLVSVARNDVDPAETIELLTGSGSGLRYHVSQLQSSGEFILVPSSDGLNGTDRQIYRMPVSGGSATVFLDPTTSSGLNGNAMLAGRVDSQDRLVLAWGGSSNSIRVRRFSADLLSSEDWTIARPTSDFTLYTANDSALAISPDGNHVAGIYRYAAVQEIRFYEYALESGGGSTATLHKTGGADITNGSENFTGALYAVGYHGDGGVLYGWTEQRFSGPAGETVHPCEIIVAKFGGTLGGFERILSSFDADPDDHSPHHLSTPAGISGRLVGSGDTVFGWTGFADTVSPNGQLAYFIFESDGPSASFRLWENGPFDESPLWLGGAFRPAGCTEGARSGDIYAYLNSVSTNGGVYRFDQDGALKEIMPVTASVSLPQAETLRLFDGDLYAVGGNPGKLVKIGGSIPHVVTELYNWTGNPDSDVAAESLTFDSDGNIYVRMHGAAGTGGGGGTTRAVVLYKLQPDGTFIWRKSLPTDHDANAGFVWLANDDKTLLYDCFLDTQFEVIKRYDLLADAPMSNLFTILSPNDHGSPPGSGSVFPFYFTEKPGAVLLPTGKLVRTVANIEDTLTVADSGIGYRGNPRFVYESGHQVASVYQDEGCDIDTDPDDVSLWISSEAFPNLYRFNRVSGAVTKTLTLLSEDGDDWPAMTFALCGGAEGHGGPPPEEVARRRRGGQPFFLP